jgi:hypothetical protein
MYSLKSGLHKPLSSHARSQLHIRIQPLQITRSVPRPNAIFNYVRSYRTLSVVCHFAIQIIDVYTSRTVQQHDWYES